MPENEIDIDVTDTELSVLEILWANPEGISVREIVLKLYGRHEHSLHGGVKSFLDRLMEKGLVTVDKSGFAHRFAAVLDRQEFVGLQLKKMAHSHFGGSLAPMLLSLVDQAKLSDKQRASIEKIIKDIKD
ncbi:BlaI/MecI/CopY family transcriptional regulator [Gimesia algae]|uniref:Transcriptional regulator BlaI n=1 Tax=Gimesia algae TaxID=2527971 RepID=A0A517VGT5_9PLAN|nr:BlaI/MecI/CopY family transcriptional regulator [Gimesia algae]QDT92228.1 Transcriptional regulator BlaI [Gimesia algae]